MNVPDLVQRKLGDEEVVAGISIGDEDAVCLTPTRTLVYRGEGLLSDEQTEEYSHDVEQVAVSEGRRKTKFVLQYIEGTESFTVPANRGEKVLELFLQGVLRLEGVIEPRESIVGVYRFSELTVIIAEGRVIKLVGELVWTDDYEVYAFEDVTGLEFERASVATSIALSIDGRPQRIKVPNDKAPIVRQTLEKALFEYYDVGSLDELNRTVADESGADAGAVDAAEERSDDLSFGTDFDPLVSDDDDLTESVDTDDDLTTDEVADVRPSGTDAEATERTDAEPADRGETGSADRGETESADRSEPNARAQDSAGATRSDAARGSTGKGSESTASGTETADRTDQPEQSASDGARRSGDAGRSGGAQRSGDAGRGDAQRSGDAGAAAGSERTAEAGAEQGSGGDGAGTEAEAVTAQTEPAIIREEFEAVAGRLDDLTEAVERQNELLKRQHKAIKQLVRHQQESE